MRRLAVLALAASFASVSCSSGGGHHPPVAVTHPAPGYRTPGAAVVGFFTEYAAGKNTACAYVISADFLSCDEAITQSNVTSTISGLGIGATTILGTEALVTVVGKLCVTQGSTTNCRQNNDPSVGQPPKGSKSAFDAAFAKAGVGRPINTTALPCEQILGKWYISLEGSVTG